MTLLHLAYFRHVIPNPSRVFGNLQYSSNHELKIVASAQVAQKMEKGSAISANSQAQLDKAWADAYLNAEQQFARITKKYLKGSDGMPMLQGKIRPQDLTDQVQTRKKNQDKDRESHHKWTQVLQSVLLPIDRLGGLVAGAMSVVRHSRITH